MADELDWLELLVASERVEKWLDIICSPTSSTAVRVAALQKFAAAVQFREAYAEEARQAGAVARLTSHLSSWEDRPALRQAAVLACTQLELASAFRQQVSTVQYGDFSIMLKEGALGDGLGARVWAVAHTLCRHLIAHPDIVANKSVLEIGAGCGVCGILAVKLKAREVFLTDHELKVLENLSNCVARNFPAQANSTFSSKSQPSAHQESGTSPQQDDDELCDPEDAESCDDLDDLFRPSTDTLAAPCNADIKWDYGNAHVRYLDWQESVDLEATRCRPATCQPATEATTSAPKLGMEHKYGLILGTDILYEAAHAPMVAAVVRQCLACDGQALLCCAVREQAVFDQFAQELSSRHMHYVIDPIQPKADDLGILGKQHDYEGGFVMVTVQHGH